ncbi:hypothetical protein L6164_010349 [Bauhinia variegata]|uniref:Uncharacterized protein n=1 Tax=Bauhinia variegata TaxID=167791 RepID=A0ACB9PMQ1_BAUVA|nr:hypothetical protein L6164_010349 [Bauhinia variegata]
MVKLDRTNFLLWESLILPTIRGNKLEGYITGAKKCRVQFLDDGKEKKLNPEFEDWVAYDQLLLGCLFNSMTLDIASQLIHYKTSKDLSTAARELLAQTLDNESLF